MKENDPNGGYQRSSVRGVANDGIGTIRDQFVILLQRQLESEVPRKAFVADQTQQRPATGQAYAQSRQGCHT